MRLRAPTTLLVCAAALLAGAAPAAADPVTVTGTADPDGTVTTDPGHTGPTADRPMTVSVTTPIGGDISITLSDLPPGGIDDHWPLIGNEALIDVPESTPENPLQIVFTVLLPAGVTPEDVVAFRDRDRLRECPDPSVAEPNPCILQIRSVDGGSAAEVTVLSSHGRTWDIGHVRLPAPDPAPAPAIPDTQPATTTAATTTATPVAPALVTELVPSQTSAPSPVAPAPLVSTPKPCKVPNLKRLTVRSARDIATRAGCRIGMVTRKLRTGLPSGRIYGQSVRAGHLSLPGRRINLFVSL